MSNETQQKQGFEIHPIGWRKLNQAIDQEVGKALDSETAESWQRVHAQLLKSVADAQGRLLAAQNETADKLTDVVIPVLASLENRLIEAHNHDAWLIGRLEAIEAKLGRRQVERLRTKRIVKEPRKKRHA